MRWNRVQDDGSGSRIRPTEFDIKMEANLKMSGV